MTDDPDIIEAAARALVLSFLGERRWKDLSPVVHDNYRSRAREILTAVTPLIRAAALEEAAKVADFRGGLSPDPERIIAKQIAADLRALKEQP